MVASVAVSRLQPWKFAIFVARNVRFCTAVNTNTSAQFQARIAEETQRWAKLIRDNKIEVAQ